MRRSKNVMLFKLGYEPEIVKRTEHSDGTAVLRPKRGSTSPILESDLHDPQIDWDRLAEMHAAVDPEAQQVAFESLHHLWVSGELESIVSPLPKPLEEIL